MEKKDNVEKGVSGKPEERNRQRIMKSVRNLVTEGRQRFYCISGRGLPFSLLLRLV